jgi:hypothetical protein
VRRQLAACGGSVAHCDGGRRGRYSETVLGVKTGGWDGGRKTWCEIQGGRGVGIRVVVAGWGMVRVT